MAESGIDNPGYQLHYALACDIHGYIFCVDLHGLSEFKVDHYFLLGPKLCTTIKLDGRVSILNVLLIHLLYA